MTDVGLDDVDGFKSESEVGKTRACNWLSQPDTAASLKAYLNWKLLKGTIGNS